MPSTTKQWRTPVAVQIIPGGLMFVGLFFLKESPRWLTKKERHDKAVQSLAHVRSQAIDSPETVEEIAEIRASIEEEKRATAGTSWRIIFKKGTRKRFILAFVMMVCFHSTLMTSYSQPLNSCPSIC